MNAVIDEDLPRSFTRLLAQKGFTVFDVRDEGLRGASDETVFQFACEKNTILFTGDLGFSMMFFAADQTPEAVVILRFPNEMSTTAVNNHVSSLLKELDERDYTDGLVVLSPGKIRIRRKTRVH